MQNGNEKPSYSPQEIGLLVLLGIRAVGNFLAGMNVPILFIFALFYAAAFGGVFRREDWGPKLSLGIAALDLILAIALSGGAFSVGAIVVDTIIIGFSYQLMMGVPRKK